MKIISTISSLEKERDALISAHRCKVTLQMEADWESKKKLLQHLSLYQGRTYTVFDLKNGAHILHNSSHRLWQMHPAVNVDEPLNSRQTILLTHPDDLSFALESEIEGYKFLMLLPPGRRKEFLLSYPRRLKDNKGNFQAYWHDYTIIMSDAEDEPWLMLTETVQLTHGHANDLEQYRLLSPSWNVQAEIEQYFQLDKKNRLSSRELEVLTLVADGCLISEIAGKLSISEWTVKTHRANIIRKMNVTSLHMACQVARNLLIIK